MSDNLYMNFQFVSLFKYNGILLPYRIENNQLPKGLHKCEIRHSDYSPMIPVAAGEYVGINFLGTFVSKNTINTGLYGHLVQINRDNDWTWNAPDTMDTLNIFGQLSEILNYIRRNDIENINLPD